MTKNRASKRRLQDTTYEPQSFRGQGTFRNRPQKTGLDPFDTSMEVARAEGTFIRKLFTGQVRTRNVAGLALMLMGGLFCPLPFIATVIEISTGATPSIYVRTSSGDPIWVLVILATGMTVTGTIVGALFLYSVITSLRKPRPRKNHR